MKSWMTAAALLAAASAASAQDAEPPAKPAETKPAPDPLDEEFYRAYYQENGLRDFEKAAAFRDQIRAIKTRDLGLGTPALS